MNHSSFQRIFVRYKYIFPALLLLLLLLSSPCLTMISQASSPGSRELSRQELEELDRQLAAAQKQAQDNALAASQELSALEQEIQAAQRLYTLILLGCGVGVLTVLTVFFHYWKKNNASDDE